MGSGSSALSASADRSSSRNPHGSTIVVNGKLNRGAALLAESSGARKHFSSYIKGGVWIEKLAKFTHRSSARNHTTRLAEAKGKRIYQYSIDERLLYLYKELVNGEKSFMMTARDSNNSREDKKRPDNRDNGVDFYKDLEASSCFTSEQLLSFMLGIVFLIYEESDEYDFWQKGLNDLHLHAMSSGDEPDTDPSLLQTDSSKRVQQLMHSVAAYFDETELIETMEKGTWLDVLSNAVHTCPLAISITDTSTEDLSTVYANEALRKMAGQRHNTMIGAPFELMMMGSAVTTKEAEAQSEGLFTALREGTAAKVALCQETSSKAKNNNSQPALKLVAVEPILNKDSQMHQYSVSAHFIPQAAGGNKDYEMIDDVLTLLGSLIQPDHQQQQAETLSASNKKTRSSTHSSICSQTTTSSAYSTASHSVAVADNDAN